MIGVNSFLPLIQAEMRSAEGKTSKMKDSNLMPLFTVGLMVLSVVSS